MFNNLKKEYLERVEKNVAIDKFVKWANENGSHYLVYGHPHNEYKVIVDNDNMIIYKRRSQFIEEVVLVNDKFLDTIDINEVNEYFDSLLAPEELEDDDEDEDEE